MASRSSGSLDVSLFFSFFFQSHQSLSPSLLRLNRKHASFIKKRKKVNETKIKVKKVKKLKKKKEKRKKKK